MNSPGYVQHSTNLVRGEKERNLKRQNDDVKKKKKEEQSLANKLSHFCTGPLVRSLPRYPPRLSARPQTPHPLRLLNRLLPPHPLPRRRPPLPNSPRRSSRPVHSLIYSRAERHRRTRRRVPLLLVPAPHRRPRPREQRPVCAGRPQTLQQRWLV